MKNGNNKSIVIIGMFVIIAGAIFVTALSSIDGSPTFRPKVVKMSSSEIELSLSVKEIKRLLKRIARMPEFTPEQTEAIVTKVDTMDPKKLKKVIYEPTMIYFFSRLVAIRTVSSMPAPELDKFLIKKLAKQLHTHLLSYKITKLECKNLQQPTFLLLGIIESDVPRSDHYISACSKILKRKPNTSQPIDHFSILIKILQ